MAMIVTHTTRNRWRDKLRTLFGGLPCRIQVAALPWRRTERGVEIMLVTSRGSGRWVLPKGWPERGEELFNAAAREAMEEAGLDGVVSRQEAGTFFYEKHLPSGAEWRCEVHVYPLEVDAVADKWPERKMRKRQWFSVEEASRLVTEPDLAELIARFAQNPRQTIS